MRVPSNLEISCDHQGCIESDRTRLVLGGGLDCEGEQTKTEKWRRSTPGPLCHRGCVVIGPRVPVRPNCPKLRFL